jgi:hypothetical protein
MANKPEVEVATSFHLGDRVRIKDLPSQVGRIAELRGPLGPGGASVYRVRVKRKPRISYIELLGDQLEFLPNAGELVHAKARKAAPKKPKALGEN